MPVPTKRPSLKIETAVPVAAVPVNTGVVTFVMLSVFEMPLSVAAVMSGVLGAEGGTLSKVIVLSVLVDAVFPLPATSWTLLPLIES